MSNQPKTTRFGADPLLNFELANKQYVDGQGGQGIDLTTKGDLHGFSTVDARIAVGAEGQVPVSRAAAALGIAWEAPAGGGNTFARKVKPALETRTNDATLTDDDTMVVAILANKVYTFQVHLFYESVAAADIKIAFGLPSSPTTSGKNTSSWTEADIAIEDADTSTQINTDGTRVSSMFTGFVENVNAGNLSFQWAQNTSNAGATTVLAGSYMLVWEQE